MLARGETPGPLKPIPVKPRRGGGRRHKPLSVAPLGLPLTLLRMNQGLHPWLVSFAPLGRKWYAQSQVEGARIPNAHRSAVLTRRRKRNSALATEAIPCGT